MTPIVRHICIIYFYSTLILTAIVTQRCNKTAASSHTYVRSEILKPFPPIGELTVISGVAKVQAA